MIRKILCFLALILLAQHMQAQLDPYDYRFGSYIDEDNQPLNGYLDVNYESKTSNTSSIIVGKDYTPGYYYDHAGMKYEGKIKYLQQNGEPIKFKASEDKKGDNIYPAECMGYVIAKDTFTTIRNFKVERALGGFENEGPEFAEVIAVINGVNFYKHTRVGANNVVITYMAGRDNDGPTSFSQQADKFKSAALAFFGHVNFLKEMIDSGEYSDDNILAMVRHLDYYTKYKAKERVYYSVSWEEMTDTSGFFYYADIIRMERDNWTLRYFFKDGTPLYEGTYESMLDMTKQGMFTFWYPDGKLRKKINYVDDEIEGKVEEYYPNGSLHYEYAQKRRKYSYIRIMNRQGTNLLDADGNGTEIFYDSLMQREITRVYNKGVLSTSYYTQSNGDKVYQACKTCGREYLDQTGEVKEIIYPRSAVLNNIHGMVLVRILVDKDGKTTNVSIIKGISDACDKMIMEHCKSKYAGQHWIPAKVDKENQSQELVRAYIFKMNRYTWYRNSSYNHDYHWRFQQQMMHRQMMQNISPPTFR